MVKLGPQSSFPLMVGLRPRQCSSRAELEGTDVCAGALRRAIASVVVQKTIDGDALVDGWRICPERQIQSVGIHESRIAREVVRLARTLDAARVVVVLALLPSMEQATAPAVSPSTAKEPTEAPPNPLERFTSGGWVKGLLRLGLGLALVGAVIWFTGASSLELLLDRQVALLLVVGSVVQIGLRVCRILKWSRIIEPAGLVKRPWTYLLRIQLIGMLGNVALPMSEPLKVWAVAANRRQVLRASESIVIETTVHTCLVGVAGCLGLLLAGSSFPALVWWAAGGMAAIPVVLIAGLGWWPRRERPSFHIVDLRVIGWAAGETACQLAVYALAVRAIGIDVQLEQLLALGPLLFVTDLAMVTPSGLGVREAVYAVVLQSLSGAPPEAAVAVGLLVSTMLMVAAITGGGVALALPGSSTNLPTTE